MTATKKKQREKSKKHFEKRSYYRKMWRHLLTNNYNANIAYCFTK